MSRAIHSPPYRKLRQSLMDARIESGLTQTQVAVKLKRPQSFVSKYESGERQLDAVEFAKVCQVLGVKPGTVLDTLF